MAPSQILVQNHFIYFFFVLHNCFASLNFWSRWIKALETHELAIYSKAWMFHGPTNQVHTQISIIHYITRCMQIFKHNKWSIISSVCCGGSPFQSWSYHQWITELHLQIWLRQSLHIILTLLKLESPMFAWNKGEQTHLSNFQIAFIALFSQMVSLHKPCQDGVQRQTLHDTKQKHALKVVKEFKVLLFKTPKHPFSFNASLICSLMLEPTK